MSYSTTVFRIQQTETALQYLIEATKRKKSANALAKPIQVLHARLGDLFIRQGNALVRALSPLRSVLQEDAVTKQFDAIFDDATANTSLDMLAALENAYKTALSLGATQQLAEVGIKISFKLDNPRAAHYIAGYGADQIAGIDETSKADIRNLLEAAVKNGTSYTELAQSIKARYKHYAVGVPQQHIRSRAELIAITEIGNGYTAGNHSSMQAVQDAGVKMEKKWLTVGDLRVSDGCRDNQGQNWIPLNQEHLSGDLHPLRFPGCRCVEQYQRDKSASAVLRAQPPESTFNAREFKTGAEADKYYSKNSPLQSDDLDYFHQAALQSYQHEGYKGINGGLRTGDKKLLKEWKDETKRLDETFASTVTTEDILAHRGMFVAPGTAAQALLDTWIPGETFEESGFLSTTVDKNRVSKFLKSINAKDKPKGAKDVFIEVQVPKGTHAIYMNGCVEQRGITNYKEEKELLIARGSKYRIISKETDAKGVTRVVMEIIP